MHIVQTVYSQVLLPADQSVCLFVETYQIVDVIGLYLSGQTQKLAEELPKMIQDPLYAFFDFEKGLLNVGNMLLQSGRVPQTQASIQVFSMVLELFPNSANAYKYLGQSYMAIGETQKAKEVLKKAIALDTVGQIGKVAKALLSDIGNK